MIGPAELVDHLGHTMTLVGEFEERDDGLVFVVEDFAHVAGSCVTEAGHGADTGERA